MAYDGKGGIGFYASSSTEELIVCEAGILADICGCPITTVSMHRPSKATLEEDLKIPDMVNSYGQTFSTTSSTSPTVAAVGGSRWRISSAAESMTAFIS